jgi:hypothetical protein
VCYQTALLPERLSDQFEKVTLNKPIPGWAASTLLDFEIETHRRVPGRSHQGWIAVIVERGAGDSFYKASVTVSFDGVTVTVWAVRFPEDANPKGFARAVLPGIVKRIFESKVWA